MNVAPQDELGTRCDTFSDVVRVWERHAQRGRVAETTRQPTESPSALQQRESWACISMPVFNCSPVLSRREWLHGCFSSIAFGGSGDQTILGVPSAVMASGVRWAKTLLPSCLTIDILKRPVIEHIRRATA